jgi:hypothetical protein
MLKNRGQFQRGMSLPEFVEQCGTQSQCERALFAWRWPLGFVCPECGGSSACALKSRRLYQCRACGRQTSVTVRPLIFSNPATGQVETIASGEPCNLVGSVEEERPATRPDGDLGCGNQPQAWQLRRLVARGSARRRT